MNKEEKISPKMYWQLVIKDEEIDLNLEGLKNAIQKSFEKDVSDNYKQKLVYNLLDATKNNDQKQFFYILLKAINKPKENYRELWIILEKNYNIMPEEAFINFAYSIILGIMATYSGGEKNE